MVLKGIKIGVVEINEASTQKLLLGSPLVSVEVFKEVISSLKEELDDHRLSINDNTDEIQSSFALLCELDKKIEKIAERLDELHLAVNGGKAKKEFKITPLTNKEKEVFMALYSLGEVQPFVSYRQIAKKVRSSENLVASYITNLIEKGVPIIKKYDGGIAYIKLDDLFRQVQAKENLVGVNTVLSYWM